MLTQPRAFSFSENRLIQYEPTTENAGTQARRAGMLVLHARQAEFLRTRSRFALFCGGIGSGKTFTGALRFLLRSLGNPASRGFVLANTYDQLQGATLRELAHVAGLLGIEAQVNHSQRTIELGGAAAHFRGLERFDDLRGLEMGHFWIDEARDVKAEAWDVVRGRLRQKSGVLQGDLTSTPNGISHWLYAQFEAGASENCALVRASTADNRANLPAAYVEDLEHAYEGAWYDQEVLGRFTNIRRGRCYRYFDRLIHARRPMSFEPSLDLLVGVDFNVDPMTAAVAQQIGGALHVLAEFHQRDADTYELRDWLLSKWQPRLQLGARIICFPDASARARSTTGRSNAAILQEHFACRAPRGNPAQRDRVNAVNRILREERLVIDPACAHLIASLEETVWNEDATGIDKSGGVEHISDALGYLVCELYPLRRPTRVEQHRL